MTPEQNYLEINRQSWNNRVATHLKSDFYDLPNFIKGATSLNPIELALLPDLKGKTVLHLQCHFGQDSISMSRLGAAVTGVDLSDKAIESAVQLAAETGADAKFICCDIYDLPAHLEAQFDLVFTSYGTIGWLPDLDKWAEIISRYLKPGGQFVFVEFHPVVWMFDDAFEKVGYNYFKAGPIVETETGTYADKAADIVQTSVSWNHGLGEVLSSLIGAGLQMAHFQEYDYSPYNCFQKTVEVAPRKYRIAHLDNNIPMVYSVVATKGNGVAASGPVC